jgi:hypothetical protein
MLLGAFGWDMSVTEIEVPVDASTATDQDGWLALIDRIGEDEGYFQTLGPRHWAMFVDDGPRLLVTFETIETARARPGQMPLGHEIAAQMGWSHLCLIAEEAPWFRDPAVWAYFDRLVDEAFFEDFDRVAFYGAGPLGYAACAYSVVAPGARVLALAPPATLEPGTAGWDNRHRAARRLDFTSRYGFAPDMIEGAARVTLVSDPLQRLDQMHAALFRGPQVLHLPARHAGADLETCFARLDILAPLIIAAVEGNLTPSAFARLWRKRRDDASVLRSLHQAVEARGSLTRMRALCENVTRRLNIPRYRKRLAEMNAASPPDAG